MPVVVAGSVTVRVRGFASVSPPFLSKLTAKVFFGSTPVPGSVPGPVPGSVPGPVPGSVPGPMPGSVPGSTSESVPGSVPGIVPGSKPVLGVVPGSGFEEEQELRAAPNTKTHNTPTRDNRFITSNASNTAPTQHSSIYFHILQHAFYKSIPKKHIA